MSTTRDRATDAEYEWKAHGIRARAPACDVDHDKRPHADDGDDRDDYDDDDADEE